MLLGHDAGVGGAPAFDMHPRYPGSVGEGGFSYGCTNGHGAILPDEDIECRDLTPELRSDPLLSKERVAACCRVRSLEGISYTFPISTAPSLSQEYKIGLLSCTVSKCTGRDQSFWMFLRTRSV